MLDNKSPLPVAIHALVDNFGDTLYTYMIEEVSDGRSKLTTCLQVVGHIRG